MKKLVSLLLVVACVLSLVACGGNKDTEKEKLIVGTEAGFAPYEDMNGDEVVGVDMDIAKANAEELGIDMEIKNMDFDGALLAVQNGKVDFVAAGVSVDPERDEVMDFSHEYVSSTEVIVVNKANPAVSAAGDELAGSDLDGKIVAVQQGNIADIWVSNADNCSPKEIKRYTKFAQAAEDLKNGKVDCIVMDELPAKDLVAANAELVILDGTLFEDKYAIAVDEGNKELLDKINKVIDKLIADGKIDEFIANHAAK